MTNRTRIKMCGMMRKEDVLYATKLGVDAIGLIFYQKSPRNLSIEHAYALLKNKSVFLDTVAVCVNPEQAFVWQMLKELSIQYLQFHGDESPEFCAQFGVPYIKAVSASSHEAIIQATKLYNDASAILLDTPSEKHGGSGITFNWDIIPEQLCMPIILAGGLNATNIQNALMQTPVDAVDVCSGVEVSAGIKDHEKMKRFVKACFK